jgi:hypothetical protein
MKLNELISRFEIFKTNEEAHLLDKMSGAMTPSQFTEREMRVVEQLVKKSLITKRIEDETVYLVKNGKPY